MRNKAFAAALATLAWLLPGGAAAAEPLAIAPTAEQRAAYAAACATYANRARFLSRDGGSSFVVAMADGCRAAQRSLDAEGRHERASAVGYLDRLVQLRNVVIAIATDRIYGAGAGPRAKPRTGSGRLMPLGQVSETGEFLIAHRMGLIAAFDSWRAQAPEAAVALGAGALR